MIIYGLFICYVGMADQFYLFLKPPLSKAISLVSTGDTKLVSMITSNVEVEIEFESTP